MLGDPEPDRPESGAHQVHAEQTGEQEVDVARALLLDRVDGEDLGRHLAECDQEAQAGELGVGTHGIQAHLGGVHGGQPGVDLATAQAVLGLVAGGVGLDVQVVHLVQKRGRVRGQGVGDHRDEAGLGVAALEGETEHGGQDHGEREHPEHGFGLANEGQHTVARHLEQFGPAASFRVEIRHRAGASRSGP